MRIIVRTLKGTLELQSNSTDLISTLKEKIAAVDSYYANFHLELIFGGRILSDQSTVGMEKLKENCSLHLLTSELVPDNKTEIDGVNIPSKNSSMESFSSGSSLSKSPMLIDSPKSSPSEDSYIVTGKAKVNYHSSEVVLRGSRWNIRGFKEGNVKLDEGKMGQSVFVQDCMDSQIRITSKKVNHILIDRCSDSTIEFNSVIASVEIVNCKNVVVKCHGRVSLVQVDLTQNLTFYLNSKVEDITNIKFVNASCADVFLVEEEHQIKFQVPTSLLQDQLASKISFSDAENKFKLKTLHSNSMTKGGIPNLSLLDSKDSPLVGRSLKMD